MPNLIRNRRILQPSTTFTPLLDTYGTGVKSAWSMRKLKGSATSPFRVRRGSDSVEMDVGFVGQEADTAGMLNFLAGSDGFITTIYDQSGNAQHLTQTSVTAQFKIANAGVLVTENNKAFNSADGVNDFMSVNSSTAYYKFLHDGTADYYIFSVQKFGTTSNPDTRYTLLCSASATTAVGKWLLYDDRSGSANNNAVSGIIYRGVSSTTAATSMTQNAINPNQLMQMTTVGSPGNATAADRLYWHINSGAALKSNVSTSTVSTANATADLRVGATNAGSVLFLGGIGEIIMYTGDMSANRASIEANQKTYWGTP
ncbi:MAG: hypothetical protein EOP56_09485 [Sphingobacteriales bacterium]|nr:MAG: hypothetical protein EOP56_09485 [Sphingobacteriales bacterium]